MMTDLEAATGATMAVTGSQRWWLLRLSTATVPTPAACAFALILQPLVATTNNTSEAQAVTSVPLTVQVVTSFDSQTFLFFLLYMLGDHFSSLYNLLFFELNSLWNCNSHFSS